jgi:hypothetical protein
MTAPRQNTPVKSLTVAALMLLLRNDVTAWAKPLGGTVSVASERFNALELLQQQPGAMRVVISYGGWKKRGDYEETRAVDHTFKFCISTARVLTAIAGDGMIVPVAGKTPLFELTDKLSAKLRAIELPDGSTEGTLDLIECGEVTTPEGTRVDAYEITATLGATQSDTQ